MLNLSVIDELQKFGKEAQNTKIRCAGVGRVIKKIGSEASRETQ